MNRRCMENVGWETQPYRCNQPAVAGVGMAARCKDHAAINRWAAFTDDELEMIVSWKQSLDAAVRTGSRRYEPDDSFGEAIEAELERRNNHQ